MSLVDELRSLDVNDIGRWPLVFRVAVIGIVFEFSFSAYITIPLEKVSVTVITKFFYLGSSSHAELILVIGLPEPFFRRQRRCPSSLFDVRKLWRVTRDNSFDSAEPLNRVMLVSTGTSK